MSKTAVIKIEVSGDEVIVEAKDTSVADMTRAIMALKDCVKELIEKELRGVK